MFIRATGLVIS